MFEYTEDLKLRVWVITEKWINEDGNETDTVFGVYDSKETAKRLLNKYFERYNDEFVLVPEDSHYEAHYSPNGSTNNMFFIDCFSVQDNLTIEE